MSRQAPDHVLRVILRSGGNMKKQMHEPYNLATLVFRLTKGAHKWVVEQAAQHPRGISYFLRNLVEEARAKHK